MYIYIYIYMYVCVLYIYIYIHIYRLGVPAFGNPGLCVGHRRALQCVVPRRHTQLRRGVRLTQHTINSQNSYSKIAQRHNNYPKRVCMCMCVYIYIYIYIYIYLFSFGEECDDANLIAGDGCYRCSVERG